MSDAALVLIGLIAAIAALAWLTNVRRVHLIYPPHVGLLYRDGRFEKELAPGRYTFFDPFRRVHVGQVWTSTRPVTLGEFAVVSKDQFAFRLGLSPVMEVTDAREFAESQPPNQMSAFMVHFAMQPMTAAAAQEVVAAHGLRDLLADPKMLADAIQQKIETAVPGARVGQVLLTSITMPPETRKMFTEVERSKMEAEASLERARGEQASLRALANAARLIKDNPALANLRFLQTLEQAPGAKTIVIGGNAVPLDFGTA
jgi:regulator of protease activity HflC (stomatin/prohibitin superfamily)